MTLTIFVQADAHTSRELVQKLTSAGDDLQEKLPVTFPARFSTRASLSGNSWGRDAAPRCYVDYFNISSVWGTPSRTPVAVKVIVVPRGIISSCLNLAIGRCQIERCCKWIGVDIILGPSCYVSLWDGVSGWMLSEHLSVVIVEDEESASSRYPQEIFFQSCNPSFFQPCEFGCKPALFYKRKKASKQELLEIIRATGIKSCFHGNSHERDSEPGLLLGLFSLPHLKRMELVDRLATILPWSQRVVCDGKNVEEETMVNDDRCCRGWGR
ncbi:hypothetical protein NE237_017696 [Protea cynaroides]|uniref:Uncharacterized protein n=1 Tax=Protea cynaroides TaxID=273540 RepID=A0A9Q0QN94_9MAGN|nr:hypothetical protein NE237_017696 [Protea cynaroides]